MLPRLSAHVQLATPEGDGAARVIVGRPGVGKTRHLKELRRRLEEAGGSDLMAHDFGPSISEVIRVAGEIELRTPAERVDIWRKLWKRAIARAAASYLLDEADETAECAPLAALRSHRHDLLGTAAGPRPISAEFDRILNENGSLKRLLEFLNDPGWHEVDEALGFALRKRSKPLCYFLDIVEDESTYAPLYWLWCMKGLLRQIIRYPLEPFAAPDRLHIYMAVREQTWIALKKLMPTVEQHPNVRVLRWDAPALLTFFANKIKQLPERYRMGYIDPDGAPEDTIGEWLGSITIENTVRSTVESMHSYVLRHTRLIPRDVVSMGNDLAKEVLIARKTDNGEAELDPKGIQLVVANAALRAGREELHWCALEIVSDRLTHARTTKERVAILPDEEAVGRVSDGLVSLLGSCSSDVISDEELSDVAQDAAAEFGNDVDLESLLWRHGLIGWGPGPGGPFRFSYGAGLLGHDAPPPKDTHIAMHPSMIDAVNVKPHGNDPIDPFSEERE